MKPVYILLVLLLTYNLSDAQIYEIGVFGGGSNFVGGRWSNHVYCPKRIVLSEEF